MLLDLNKEYLKDMGVNVLGDIIAILKHSKLYHEKVDIWISEVQRNRINYLNFFYRLSEIRFLQMMKGKSPL